MLYAIIGRSSFCFFELLSGNSPWKFNFVNGHSMPQRPQAEKKNPLSKEEPLALRENLKTESQASFWVVLDHFWERTWGRLAVGATDGILCAETCPHQPHSFCFFRHWLEKFFLNVLTGSSRVIPVHRWLSAFTCDFTPSPFSGFLACFVLHMAHQNLYLAIWPPKLAPRL